VGHDSFMCATNSSLAFDVTHSYVRQDSFNVLQCVAVCRSVLQCVAVCCGVLQCVAVRCSVLQCVAVRIV